MTIPHKKIGVYLAGSIDRADPEFAVGWREEATKVLNKYGIDTHNPLRDFNLKDYSIDSTAYTKSTAYNEIIKPDLDMIQSSDIILAEISRVDIPYHGTSMELVYGSIWDKSIYVWGGCKSSWVIYHADKVFATMDDAIAHILFTYKGELL